MRSWNEICGAGVARRERVGFTLVEILAVVAIIGLLAAATLVALGGARGFFNSVTAKARLDDVSQALEIYFQKYGEYPPDCCATDQEIQRHILKRWPKALKGGATSITNMVAFARAEMQRTPSSAALFWLAGPPDEADDGTFVYDGFLVDVNNPFGLDANGVRLPYDDLQDEPTVTPIIELQYDSDGTNNGNYNTNGLIFKGTSLAYFRAHSKNGYAGRDFHVNGESDVAAPYMNGGSWYKPDSFQLILPGEDGIFGFRTEEHEHEEAEHEHGGRDLADSDSMSTNDWDNVTNFSNGATLEQERN